MSGLNPQRALIIYNKPLYQMLILEKRDPHYYRLLKTKHPSTRKWKLVYDQHHETLEGVQRTLQLLGIPTDLMYRKKVRGIEAYDLVLTVGGDGTFLEASHFIGRQVLMGINATPLESTGALCPTRLDNFLQVMIDLLMGTVKPKILPRLKVKLGKKTLPFPALNEVLFANHSPAGTSRYLMQIGKRLEEHKSSGVWIATGTGSTAALRSAGGKPFPRTHAGMEYVVRELFPLKGADYHLRRGILPKGQKIIFLPTMRQGSVFIDGNHVEIPVTYGERVEVSSGWRPIKAVM